MAEGKLDRRTLGLAALAAPIVGMIALFAWAGAASGAGSTSAVQSFIAAYNQHNCTAVAKALYRAPGLPTPTCADLFGSQPATFDNCTETTLPNSQVGALASRVPSGYSSIRLVRADCTRRVQATGSSAKVHLDFLLADDPSGRQYVITVGYG